MAPLPISLRQTILQSIIAALTAVQVPLPDGTTLPFGIVSFGPLPDEARRKRFSVGVVPGRDNPEYEASYVMHSMEVDIEFSVSVQSSDPGSTYVSAALMSETILTQVQLVMLADTRWGGYAIDTKITGSETGVRTSTEKSLMGVLNTVISYRHNVLDPRDPAPGIG